jgi:hypothetical protein
MIELAGFTFEGSGTCCTIIRFLVNNDYLLLIYK